MLIDVRLTTMNGLSTIYDGDTILRVSGNFGKSKTVTVNNFGGVTYVHLKTPKKDSPGWKNFTMSLVEYREFIRIASPGVVAQIAQNFDVQVSLQFHLLFSIKKYSISSFYASRKLASNIL